MGPMKIGTILLLAAGAGLYAVGQSMELRGDIAPFAASGVSTERAVYHVAALLLMLGAFACFIGAGFTIFRKKRG
jgi:hypothetical protein